VLKDNIKIVRKAKGLSQEDLAAQLNVVRQTVSKWEQGLSVPDSEMLLTLSKALETPVSALLGENVSEPPTEDLKTISEKLEEINLRFAQRKTARRKIVHWLFVSVCVLMVAGFAMFFILDSPYLGWDLANPEWAVAGVALHALEWFFVRSAPFVFVASLVGAICTRKKK